MKLSGAVPTIKVTGHLILRNAEGELIRYIDWRPNSFVANYYKYLIVQNFWCFSHAVPKLGMHNTVGTYGTSEASVVNYFDFVGDLFGSAGGVDGLVCGTGNTEEDFEDIDLDVALPNGAGANTLTYAGTTSSVIDAGALRKVRHVRSAFNNSGGEITVREIGFFGLASSSYFLLFRDVLDSPVVMANAEELEITFDFEITYPETIT